MMFILGSLENMLTELLSLGVTAEVLRAKTDPKSAISLQRGHFDQNFR